MLAKSGSMNPETVSRRSGFLAGCSSISQSRQLRPRRRVISRRSLFRGHCPDTSPRGLRSLTNMPLALGTCDRKVNPVDGVGSLKTEPRTRPAHPERRFVYTGADRGWPKWKSRVKLFETRMLTPELHPWQEGPVGLLRFARNTSRSADQLHQLIAFACDGHAPAQWPQPRWSHRRQSSSTSRPARRPCRRRRSRRTRPRSARVAAPRAAGPRPGFSCVAVGAPGVLPPRTGAPRACD